jgi:thiol-disulfide isomerase/thioredoxin/DNA-binding beta-propeller fold protein YncE
MRFVVWLFAVAVSALALSCGTSARPAAGPSGEDPVSTGRSSDAAGGPPIPLVVLPEPAERAPAPGFDGATAWLNIDHPVSLDELRGRVVVVDFWTSCCINCLHTLPTLARIEERFAEQPVTVIGVHSPKFEEEKESERLVDQIGQLSIAHPIAVDAEMAIWDRWGARSWPTIVVLDVEGRVVWAGGGEPSYAELSSIVASALEEGREAGKLATLPLSGLRLESISSGPLRYPGKVLALADGGLAIADTGHHRIVLLGADGSLDSVVGAGHAGFVDGGFSSARFRWPQGMAELGGRLYVADTNNHAIREIDRAARTVTTVAGNGAIGERYLGDAPEAATVIGLRSPWDVLAFDGELVIALAGSHQIGVWSPAEREVRRLAGNGREDIVDGKVGSASFAQPSALATDGAEIFVLDSETSSVRAIDPRAGAVRTLVGKGLFVFGDVDGDRHSTRLQHPIGLTYGGGSLYVADTYNSKIKRIDPRTGVTRTLYGGPSGELAEPAGLDFDDGRLIVADTNRHRIVEIGLPPAGAGKPATSALATPLSLAGVHPPRSMQQRKVEIDPDDPVAALGTVEIAPDKPSRLFVGFAIPTGTKVNAEGPARVTWLIADGLARVPAPIRTHGAEVQKGFDVTLEPAPGTKRGRLRGVLELVICDADIGRVCVPIRRNLQAEVVVREGSVPTAADVELPRAE